MSRWDSARDCPCAICPRTERGSPRRTTAGFCDSIMTTVTHNTTHITQRRRRAPQRAAMTLLELMLVLALLVVIGTLSMPAFRTPFDNHRLRQGGEVVRIEWNKARLKAMKTGQIQMFRYAAGSTTYQTMPYFSQQDWLEADAAHSTGTGLAGANQQLAMATQATDQTSTPARVLPEGVVFVQGEVETNMRSYEIQQQMQGGQVAGALESTPVLFYPDGTTSDARIVLTNQYQRLYVVVSLRSLTGITKVSNLLSSDALQQYP